MTDVNKLWVEVEALTKDTMRKTVAQAASQLYKEIVDRTPYGRPELWKMKAPAGYEPGQLQDNWEISFGGAFHKARAKGNFTGKNAAMSESKSYKLGDTITIRNETEYAERIEYGYSSQAPQGMVRVSKMMFNQFLNTATKSNRI